MSGLISGVVTALLIVAFLALFWWAWSSNRRRPFDEAAQLALDPEDRDIAVDEMEQKR